MAKKKAAPKSKFENSSNDLDAAQQILENLSTVASAPGPNQLEAINKLVTIAAATCYQIERLYWDTTCRPLVEKVAGKWDYFPATFCNRSGAEGANWPGNILRENLKLAPQLLVSGRTRKKSVSEEELKATNCLRYFMGIFSRAVLNSANERTDIPKSVKHRILSAKKPERLGVWVEEFIDWFKVAGRGVVEDVKYGELYPIAERRRQKILRTEPKADIWRGLSMIVRDQFKASVGKSFEA